MVGVLMVGTNDSSLGCRLVSASGRTILTGNGYREVNRGNTFVNFGAPSNGGVGHGARVLGRARTFRTIGGTLLSPRCNTVDSLSRISTMNREIIRNNTCFSGSILMSGSMVGGVERLTPLTPLRGLTRLRNVRTYAEIFNPGIPRITIFSATFRRAVPRGTFVCTIPCGCCRGFNMEGCNFRNASRHCISRGVTSLVNEGGRRLGLVAYRVNGNSSVATMGNNGIVSAAVKLAPLNNFVVNAHSNSLSPSIVAFVTRGRRLAPRRVSGVLGGRSNLLNVSNISSSSHSIYTTRTSNGVETRLTRRVLCCRVTGCVNDCCMTLNNYSNVMFATNVNRGRPVLHRGIYSCLRYLNIGLSGRFGGRTAYNIANALSAPSSTVEIRLVTASRRVIVTESAETVIRTLWLGWVWGFQVAVSPSWFVFSWV